MTPQRRPVGSHALYAYSTNCLIDLQAGIIVDVEDWANRTNEVNSTKTMFDRMEQRFAIKPFHLVGDTAAAF
ncbi:hypothetical protein DAMDJJ_09305 [Cupriavidus necator]|uniref:hypothetical protein n=1 Tax=Cupriavidus necator TaxID=106590 RepID=UPI003F73ED0E